MQKKLEGKVALITGGTSGIGLAAAKLFHAEGARVIATGRNSATLDAARAVLHPEIELLQSDSGDGAAIAALFAHVGERHGRLDVLFLNAGILRGGTIAAQPEADFDEVFRVNVKGPWLALKAATPLLRRGGAVVLNASINAHLGMAGASAYAASKAAVRSLARTAASELASAGVRVNVLSPGPTDTGIIEKTQPRDQVAAVHASLTERILLKRLGSSEEIARAALFLASDDSSFMTGEEIVVDGGMTRV
ncbi:SDR family oxidoreductase [Sorangium sp. So ce388]|uniref:SDR family oxidoreductase n=1 Tax=Sorangium sp. So ce388 TaxID=3133309 RepID=UPI003F5CAB16